MASRGYSATYYIPWTLQVEVWDLRLNQLGYLQPQCGYSVIPAVFRGPFLFEHKIAGAQGA